MVFFPHTPFGESSVHAFANNSTEFNYNISMQIFDIFLCLVIIYLTENFLHLKKSLKAKIYGQKKPKKSKPYQKIHFREDEMEL